MRRSVVLLYILLMSVLSMTAGAAAQATVTLAEYHEQTGEKWFLTGKKAYPVQAMMVSGETTFHNALEDVDYTVVDDGVTVILKGVVGEMWTSSLSRVQSTYAKPDGSEISAADFAVKDAFIDLVAVPRPESNYAIHVPLEVSVTVETGGGDVLHANLAGVPHGDGDYLVCNVGADGQPDLSDVWVLNGVVFQSNYDTRHAGNAVK